MRIGIRIAITMAALIWLLGACAKKWQDPAPVDDPRLTNLYCNDPTAANYNAGFPGKPDNSVCIFPSDIFQGRYYFRDSVYLNTTGLFLSADSFWIDVSKVSKEKISVVGFCGSTKLIMTAGPTYVATMDTLVGDSMTLNPGQFFCRSLDTVTGTFTRDRVDSTLLHIALQVVSDTGITVHVGKARKQ